MSIKISNDTIGKRIRDLPTFSAVPQATALPRAPIFAVRMLYKFLTILDLFQLITYIKVLADFNETRYECQERTCRLVSIPYIPAPIKSMSTRRVFLFLT